MYDSIKNVERSDGSPEATAELHAIHDQIKAQFDKNPIVCIRKHARWQQPTEKCLRYMVAVMADGWATRKNASEGLMWERWRNYWVRHYERALHGPHMKGVCKGHHTYDTQDAELSMAEDRIMAVDLRQRKRNEELNSVPLTERVIPPYDRSRPELVYPRYRRGSAYSILESTVGKEPNTLYVLPPGEYEY